MKKLLCILIFCCVNSLVFAQSVIYVSPQGNDQATGALKTPVATLDRALLLAQKATTNSPQIQLLPGTHYLKQTIQINAKQWAGKSLHISASPAERATLSGGKRVRLQWQKASENLWKAHLDNPAFEQLFVNDQQQILARYPNYTDTVRVFNGFAADALAPERIKRWSNPAGGFVHAMHAGQWGGFQYRILGKKGDELQLEGGWQNNRPSAMHNKYRFVENIFEELDAPGEWYFNVAEKTLYFYPPIGLNLAQAKIEISQLKQLIELKGQDDLPLQNVQVSGIHFSHAERTFLEKYEPLLRSDWCIYRGAAVLFENTQNCSINDCTFNNLGGNAVFVSRYNLNTAIRGCHFYDIGASAICLVGDTSAVRTVPNRYEKTTPVEKMDYVPGPKNRQYPRQCLIEDNLIHHIGRVEKQVAGIQIQVAAQITIRHNSIYQVPRAAINVGDGAFGGHLIEYNDAFETVLETSDHGAFNSWGRDRYWHFNNRNDVEMALLDAQYTTIIRNNRFRCDHGWDVDLDDGSSNYHIYNNVFLKGGLKLREGYFRVAENNVFVNNSLHPHVWFPNSGDVIQRNVFMRAYFPIGVDDWGKTIDYNFFSNTSYLAKAKSKGTDSASVAGELLFIDPAAADFRLQAGSKAFEIGFENFPMDQFGVQKPALKKIAAQPRIPELLFIADEKTTKEVSWLQAKVKSVNGLGERSAYGLPDENGVIVLELSPKSPLAKAGLQKGDVIRKANGEVVTHVEALQLIYEKVLWTGKMSVLVVRNQAELGLVVDLE